LTASFARSVVTAAVLVTAAGPIPSAPAQAQDASLHLLDVPYLPQSELLCGGAALAMVMRYWGTADVYAETFADLVDESAGGIRGEALLGALRARGWTAESVRGDPRLVQNHLRDRAPVIVLLQDRPGRFHYVVVVGWSAGRVVVHDPARAPFRVLDETAFELAWRESGHWTVTPAPPQPGPAPDLRTGGAAESGGVRALEPHASAGGPCSGMVDEGVRLAGAGDVPGARRIFEFAAESCPNASGPWREMAGLHALGRDWRSAAIDARKALDRDPGDALAARILATALFLENNPEGALEAWNRVDEPIVDLIKVTGLERTRYTVVARTMSVLPQSILAPGVLRAARRKLAELPAAQTTRVGFTPQEMGRARVDAIVLERPLFPRTPAALAALGVRTLTDREVALGISSPTGGGEMWRASWRWWEHRPRVALGLEAPAPFSGIWGVSVFGERQSYAGQASIVEESRRRVEFTISNWTMTGLRWEGSVALDRLRPARSAAGGQAFAVAGTAHQRLASDRAYLEARAGYWVGDVSTSTLAFRSEWRSRLANEGRVWIAQAGADRAAANAPLALWPGAGTGHGRDVLLRAHPLLENGIVRGGAFGQRLIHAGVEGRHWLRPRRQPIRFAPAVFLDAARAFRGLDGAGQRWQFDAGLGVRVSVPGSGVLRVDVAHGLRDGRTALSVGWVR
jgi:hypothetical protein